jgi:MFS family permease
MIIVGIAIHGICYDFFFVTGQIYVDKKSTEKIRGQAQGFLVLVTYGAGMLVGAQLAGMIYNKFLDGEPLLTLQQWQQFWWLPAMFAGGVLLFFGLLFKESITGKSDKN